MADEMARRPIKLIIQIPCFNEEEVLPATVADLPRDVPGVDVVEWLVIDDGSSDRTAEVARSLGVDHVVQHRRNRGLAAAFMTGLDAALRAGADIVVNTDADNQYDASYIAAIVAPVVAGTADMVVGERPIESIAEFSGLKKRLQRFGSYVVRKFSRTTVADAASGFRAFSRDTAMRLQVFGRYTYTMETLVQAGQEGLAVLSVPIGVNPQTRESRLVKSTRQYVMSSAQTITRTFALYRPFKFFATIGTLPFLLGLALFVRWLLLWAFADEYSSHVPSLVVAAVLVMIAVQIWVGAFLADLMAASRRLQSEARLRARRAELDGPQT
ncbi:MAG: glycosyltransferase family 2 protein [Ilumatobacteraceae bacterium]